MDRALRTVLMNENNWSCYQAMSRCSSISLTTQERSDHPNPANAWVHIKHAHCSAGEPAADHHVDDTGLHLGGNRCQRWAGTARFCTGVCQGRLTFWAMQLSHVLEQDVLACPFDIRAAEPVPLAQPLHGIQQVLAAGAVGRLAF